MYLFWTIYSQYIVVGARGKEADTQWKTRLTHKKGRSQDLVMTELGNPRRESMVGLFAGLSDPTGEYPGFHETSQWK